MQSLKKIQAWAQMKVPPWLYYIKEHSYKYIQCARERLYLNSKHWVEHYHDIHLYTYRPEVDNMLDVVYED